MAKAQARINIRVDQDIKEQSEEILDKIGISMSDLINMTLRRVVYERRIPFDTTLDEIELPAELCVNSEEELIERLKERAENDDGTGYCTLDEMRAQLNEQFNLGI